SYKPQAHVARLDIERFHVLLRLNIMQGKHNSRAATLATLLESRAANYHAGLRGGAVRSRLERASLRPFSELYEFTISSGATAQRLLVKLPFPNRARPPAAADRPRLYWPVAPELLAPLEHAAMRHIEEHFSQLNQPQFGCVRVLDLLHGPDAIVMGKVEGTILRASAVASASQRNDRDAVTAFENAGRWLRQFHQLPNLPHTKPRTTTRDDFIAMTNGFADYFPTVGAPPWMASVCEFLMRDSESTLSQDLPLGLAHGDFAPRNVIVSSGTRITVLDTLARWRAPIYEDLALFLLSLQLSRGSRALLAGDSIGLTTLSRAFLSGYGDDGECEWPVLRLFILQALLDRGCSYVSARSARNPVAALTRRCKLHVLRRIATSCISIDSL
ncbi:MAG: phosphotransferase, partial [Pirellulaceae bacterium]